VEIPLLSPTKAWFWVLSILTYGWSLLSRIRVWPPYLVINFHKTQKEEVGFPSIASNAAERREEIRRARDGGIHEEEKFRQTADAGRKGQCDVDRELE
jgi:hypothetical protein